VLCADSKLKSIQAEIVVRTAELVEAKEMHASNKDAERIGKADAAKKQSERLLKDIKQRLRNTRLTGSSSCLLQHKY
jgi:hypothetical protein